MNILLESHWVASHLPLIINASDIFLTTVNMLCLCSSYLFICLRVPFIVSVKYQATYKYFGTGVKKEVV